MKTIYIFEEKMLSNILVVWVPQEIELISKKNYAHGNIHVY